MIMANSILFFDDSEVLFDFGSSRNVRYRSLQAWRPWRQQKEVKFYCATRLILLRGRLTLRSQLSDKKRNTLRIIGYMPIFIAEVKIIPHPLLMFMPFLVWTRFDAKTSQYLGSTCGNEPINVSFLLLSNSCISLLFLSYAARRIIFQAFFATSIDFFSSSCNL